MRALQAAGTESGTAYNLPRLLLTVSVLLACLLPLPAHAHVGNKDVFEEVHAGPYTLFVTIRPPNVIPGVATIEARTSGPEVRQIAVTPTPMTGEASRHPPTADPMARSLTDASFFTGSLWLMSTGSWKVNFTLDGAAGPAIASVPVPALALSMLHMNRKLGMILSGLGALLVVGAAGIVYAGTREARLRPGTTPDAPRSRRAWGMAAVALVVVCAAVWAGGKWWNVEAAAYADRVYQPLHLDPTLTGDTLRLQVSSFVDADRPYRNRLNSDFLPDHGHLMHLYAIREPGMDAVYHLHPAPAGEGALAMQLPQMPQGHYRLFADVVHNNGLPETLTAALDVPAGFRGGALNAEDASAAPSPLTNNATTKPAGTVPDNLFHLPDGYSMAWDRPASLRSGEPARFRFTLLNAAGQPAADAVPYLGMAGHAAFVKADFSAFAHTHPEGSAPMQSVEVANGGSAQESMAGMNMPAANTPIAPTVDFPYGFPSAGRYSTLR